MPLSLAPVPPSLKSIQHYLKTATEHEARDPVVVYWCRIAALQSGLALDKSSKEALAVLLPLMDWLESTKKDMADNEAISSEVVANAHIENYAMNLFLWADKEDRAARFNKNVVKAFYTSGMLFEVLSTFGELTPEVVHHKKYAKWKAAYIHNCLKQGETPIPGPMATGEEEDLQFPGVPGASDASAPLDAQPPPPNESSGGGAGWTPAGAVPVYPNPGPGATIPNQPAYNQAGQPAAAVPPAAYTVPSVQPPAGGVKLTVEQIAKAQKFCKYAISSLDYEDLNTAILNLNKALTLCTTGHDPQ